LLLTPDKTPNPTIKKPRPNIIGAAAIAKFAQVMQKAETETELPHFIKVL